MSTPNARSRILESAVKVFAQKGFEGSRIEEISNHANVPKSLIYYHFKSKNEILEVLTQNFINEYMEVINDNYKESSHKKAEELSKRLEGVYYELGMKNADLIRVIFIESLKKTNKEPAIYKIINKMIEKESIDKGYSNSYMQKRIIAEFFTSFIPVISYICFADSWVDYFNINKDEFNKSFIKIYNETHGVYHKNLEEENYC